MASYDFIMNIKERNELVGKLEKNRKEIEQIIEDIYIIIENLQEYWSGESYDIFKQKCLDYKPALNGLVTVLEAYEKLLNGVPMEDYADKIINCIKNGQLCIANGGKRERRGYVEFEF